MASDLFVAGVAVVTGLWLFTAAVCKWAFFLQLPSIQRFARRFGEVGVQWVYGALGLGVAALGVYIAMGGQLWKWLPLR